MADAKPSTLMVRNAGTRRVILGPPPKSRGGGSPLLIGTTDDARIAAKAMKGSVPPDITELKDATADLWRKSKVLAAARAHLGLQVA